MTAPTTEKQSNALHGPNLILDVENFGPIAEAKNIEFKPMTVLVGPSNTGKTYLAMLLHAILRTIETPDASPIHPNQSYLDMSEDPRFTLFLRDLSDRVETVLNSPISRDQSFTLSVPISEYAAEIRDYLNEVRRQRLKEFATDANKAIPIYFDVSDTQALLNFQSKSTSSPRITIRDSRDNVHISIPSRSIVRCIGSDVFEFTVDGNFFDDALPADITTYIENNFDDFEYAADEFAQKFFENWPRSYYMPAGRTGLVDAYRELAVSLMRRGTRRTRARHANYSPATRQSTSEFLTSLVRLRPDSLPVDRERISNVVAVLESGVLNGKINVKETANLSHFEFEKSGHTIPLERASSMVTELAPIVLFIRQFVDEGDLLIIDEPEAHLHPEAQQQMAAALAFMVRSGLRVLITTHSHYMVEQLGNFVAVSTLDEDVRKRALKLKGALGDEDIYLDETEVAVYDFATDKSEHGSIVETVDFNQDYGYFPRDHNWAIADQMNRTQRVIEARIDQDDPVSI